MADRSAVAAAATSRRALNPLIYTICFGERCRRLAAAQLRTLMAIGQWRHDVVILGDADAAQLASDIVTVRNIVPEVERGLGLPFKEWTPVVCHNLKTRITDFLDLSAYDYVLYLDNDVLVNTPRLYDMMGELAASNLIAVQKDVVPISANMFFTGRDVLSPDEKLRWKDQAICAGIVGFPTNQLGLSFLAGWRQMNDAGGLKQSDQGNLIATLLRTYQGNWVYLKDAVIGRGASRYSETLVHFSGHRDALFFQYYSQVLGL